jgi:NADPH:quinone reductase-like Zn-dependent oxidoreductase
MRAYQLPKGGAGIDALVKIDRPNPKPAYRQVLVKVAACSLNFRDFGIVRGTYRMPVRDNIVPLSDGAGEVVEVGAGVTRVKVGDLEIDPDGYLYLLSDKSSTIARLDDLHENLN